MLASRFSLTSSCTVSRSPSSPVILYSSCSAHFLVLSCHGYRFLPFPFLYRLSPFIFTTITSTLHYQSRTKSCERTPPFADRPTLTTLAARISTQVLGYLARKVKRNPESKRTKTQIPSFPIYNVFLAHLSEKKKTKK